MDKKTKAQKREEKRKLKMKVSGKSVLTIKKILDKKARPAKND